MMAEPFGVDGSSLYSICSHSVVAASKDVELRAVRINTIHSHLVVPVVDKTLRRSDSFEECARRSDRIVATDNEDASFSIGVPNS